MDNKLSNFFFESSMPTSYMQIHAHVPCDDYDVWHDYPNSLDHQDALTTCKIYLLQALYLLLQCGHNIDEALRRRKMQAVAPSGTQSFDNNLIMQRMTSTEIWFCRFHLFWESCQKRKLVLCIECRIFVSIRSLLISPIFNVPH